MKGLGSNAEDIRDWVSPPKTPKKRSSKQQGDDLYSLKGSKDSYFDLISDFFSTDGGWLKRRQANALFDITNSSGIRVNEEAIQTNRRSKNVEMADFLPQREYDEAVLADEWKGKRRKREVRGAKKRLRAYSEGMSQEEKKKAGKSYTRSKKGLGD